MSNSKLALLAFASPTFAAAVVLTAVTACGDPASPGAIDAAAPRMADSGPADGGLDGGTATDAATDAGPTANADGSAGPQPPVGPALNHSNTSFMPWSCTRNWLEESERLHSSYEVCVEASCCEIYNRCGTTHEDLFAQDGCLRGLDLGCIASCLHAELGRTWPEASDEAIARCVRACPETLTAERPDWQRAVPLMSEFFTCMLRASPVEHIEDTGWRLIGEDEDAGADLDPAFGCFSNFDWSGWLRLADWDSLYGPDTEDAGAE